MCRLQHGILEYETHESCPKRLCQILRALGPCSGKPVGNWIVFYQHGVTAGASYRIWGAQ